jgi:hypothetical protein
MTIYHDPICLALGLRPIKELVPDYEEDNSIPEDAQLTMSGELNPFFGKKHDEEAKELMRQARIGKPLSQETKDKLSMILKGRVFSEEQRKNISASLVGRKKSKEHIENHRQSLILGGKVKGENNARFGVKASTETRDKISAALMGKMAGEKNPMYGRSAIRERNLKWYNDGAKSMRFPDGEQPDGFVKGRLGKRAWYNNGESSILCLEGQNPDGFIKGRLK